jgi:hypothetical protein
MRGLDSRNSFWGPKKWVYNTEFLTNFSSKPILVLPTPGGQPQIRLFATVYPHPSDSGLVYRLPTFLLRDRLLVISRFLNRTDGGLVCLILLPTSGRPIRTTTLSQG